MHGIAGRSVVDSVGGGQGQRDRGGWGGWGGRDGSCRWPVLGASVGMGVGVAVAFPCPVQGDVFAEIMKLQRWFAADPGELFGSDGVAARCCVGSGAGSLGGRDIRGGNQRHIDLTRMQKFLQFRGRGGNHLDLDIGIDRAETFEQGREKRDQVIFGATKRDRTAQALIRKA